MPKNLRVLAAALPVLLVASLVSGGLRQQPLSVIPAIDDAPTKAGDYDWLKRHQGVLDAYKKQKVDLLLIGDSITHGWGGVPRDPKWGDAKFDLWEKIFRPLNTVNLGFGWDRTEHVLWRFENGELDGIRPKAAVIMIGTNNTWRDTPEDIALGIGKVVEKLRQKLPSTKVLLLGIFPRDPLPSGQNRQKINAVNALIPRLADGKMVTFLNIGPKFLAPGGAITRDIMPDYLHLTPKGYQIWADAMMPTLQRLMGSQ